MPPRSVQRSADDFVLHFAPHPFTAFLAVVVPSGSLESPAVCGHD